MSDALGLTPDQAAQLAEAFGRKVSCSGKAKLLDVGCFRGDTLVATETSLRSIRDVRVGDRVWSWDEKRNRTVLRRVSRLHRKPAVRLRTLRLGSETLYTTDDHPYWVEGRGWTRAAEVAKGDVLHTQSGERLTLVANDPASRERFYAGYEERAGIWLASLGPGLGRLVYNLEVEDTHTFYVGAQRILVHNK